MGHEITSDDHVALVGERAWHGLGTVVENAPTPVEALKVAKLDWEVEQWPCVARAPGAIEAGYPDEVDVERFANVRKDTRQVLGVVSKGWKPIQNRQVAEFAEALAMEGDEVRIETAGSIRGGAKIWFLLRGDSFDAGRGDEVAPYILVSNGFDGTTALRCTPTSVRVVCSNTLHLVIPQMETSRTRLKVPGFVACHTGDVGGKVEAARAALGLYRTALAETQQVIGQLQTRELNQQAVAEFITECYSRMFEPIPVATGKKRTKALAAVGKMLEIFAQEEAKYGANAWTAANAVTGYVQHRKPRMLDPVKAKEVAMESKLFGVASERSVSAMEWALAL